MHMIKVLTNAVLERLDADTMTMGSTDYNYDLVR